MTKPPTSTNQISLSALTAAGLILEFRLLHADIDLPTAARLVKASSRGSGGLDYEAALTLIESLPPSLPPPVNEEGYRTWLSEWMRTYRPTWTRALPYGRERVLGLVEENVRQCFEIAGLTSNPPNTEVLHWWDEWGQLIRGESGYRFLLQGRDAEQRTLEHEMERLRFLGLSRSPEWIAVENAGAGYDILSFDVQNGKTVPRYVEVKSTSSSELSFYLTRNEWEIASIHGERYFVYLWQTSRWELHTLNYQQLSTHIPLDQGHGRWQDVRVGLR